MWIIESITKWTDKTGEQKEMKSYFQKFTGYPIPLKHMSGINECKKYPDKVSALIDWRKYFSHKKDAKVIRLNTLTTKNTQS